MGACEALVHGHDIAVSLGLGRQPDDELCHAVTDIFFPEISSGVRAANAPADVLLRATGRTSFDGVERVMTWDYRAAARLGRHTAG